jgi:hypothetical protein
MGTLAHKTVHTDTLNHQNRERKTTTTHTQKSGGERKRRERGVS